VTSEIHFGYTGIALVPIEKIPEAQLGYSVIPDGDTTDWKDSWLVVGHDIALGDPIFIDGSIKDLPVFTAPHGEGYWSPTMIAPSTHAFFEIFEHFAVLAKNRQHPVALEKNPPSEKELKEFMDHVSRYCSGKIPDFWSLLVDPDL
jgi:hypothetical protein